jgi:ribose 5-phosphate isomerase B
MRIAIGCDHRGLNLKKAIIQLLAELGHESDDCGCYDTGSVDYPDIACHTVKGLSQEQVDHVILICGTGIGMSIAANKLPGVRAARCLDTFSAMRSRAHNDANVLCLGGDMLGEGLAKEIVRTYLTTDFEGGRHLRRLEKIKALEQGNLPC